MFCLTLAVIKQHGCLHRAPINVSRHNSDYPRDFFLLTLIYNKQILILQNWPLNKQGHEARGYEAEVTGSRSWSLEFFQLQSQIFTFKSLGFLKMKQPHTNVYPTYLIQREIYCFAILKGIPWYDVIEYDRNSPKQTFLTLITFSTPEEIITWFAGLKRTWFAIDRWPFNTIWASDTQWTEKFRIILC